LFVQARTRGEYRLQALAARSTPTSLKQTRASVTCDIIVVATEGDVIALA
jgi:hypothetical protein